MISLTGGRAKWRKSSYSQGNGACVEVREGSTVGVRDSKQPNNGNLTINRAAFAKLLRSVR